MDFITAMGGVYDTWTEMFKYRWVDIHGDVQSNELSAPCHTAKPTLVAYAYFANLISNAEELQDVRGGHDDIIPPTEFFDYRMTAKQMMTMQRRDVVVRNR